MFTRQDIIDGLQECDCLSADVIVYVGSGVGFRVTMYEGDEDKFKAWIDENSPMGFRVTIEKKSTDKTEQIVHFIYDYEK